MPLKATPGIADETAAFSGCRHRPGVATPRAAGTVEQPAMNRSSITPLVYSCSGCSSAAQLANAVALKLDRAGLAEMSCIAGVGGDVPSLLRTAKSGRPIVGLDGCSLACVKSSLARHGLAPTLYFDLSEQGVRKRHHADFDPVQAQRVFRSVAQQIARALPARAQRESALMSPIVAEGACP
jgi:uncharacterized metal-binding protein